MRKYISLSFSIDFNCKSLNLFGRYIQYRYLKQVFDLKQFIYKTSYYDTHHDTK